MSYDFVFFGPHLLINAATQSTCFVFCSLPPFFFSIHVLGFCFLAYVQRCLGASSILGSSKYAFTTDAAYCFGVLLLFVAGYFDYWGCCQIACDSLNHVPNRSETEERHKGPLSIKHSFFKCKTFRQEDLMEHQISHVEVTVPKTV